MNNNIFSGLHKNARKKASVFYLLVIGPFSQRPRNVRVMENVANSRLCVACSTGVSCRGRQGTTTDHVCPRNGDVAD